MSEADGPRVTPPLVTVYTSIFSQTWSRIYARAVSHLGVGVTPLRSRTARPNIESIESHVVLKGRLIYFTIKE